MIVCIGIVAGLVVLLTSSQKPAPATATYSSTQSDRPKAEPGQIFFDLGTIKVSDVKVQEYTFKNSGTKPLQILNINTSCGCTAGQIIYKGDTSKEYSMHNQSGYVTEVDPGDTAVIRLTYRPATMPVYGVVERAVFVTTNDPENPKLTFSIRTKVE